MRVKIHWCSVNNVAPSINVDTVNFQLTQCAKDLCDTQQLYFFHNSISCLRIDHRYTHPIMMEIWCRGFNILANSFTPTDKDKLQQILFRERTRMYLLLKDCPASHPEFPSERQNAIPLQPKKYHFQCPCGWAWGSNNDRAISYPFPCNRCTKYSWSLEVSGPAVQSGSATTAQQQGPVQAWNHFGRNF